MRESIGNRLALLLLAAAAIGLIITRACLQSMTVDESNTVLDFVVAPAGAHWYPSSGNHVLNSALEKLTISVFGINELTARMPALFGGVTYICSAMLFCVVLSSRKLLQLPLFVLLVFNPMLLDYLIVGRGYGLAIGFLMAALTVLTRAVLFESERSFPFQASLTSFFVALSFASNFSFAYADGITMIVLFVWATTTALRSKLGYMRLAAYCFLPGIMTAIVICGPTVWDFPRSQLYFGSQSLREMWHSVISAVFDDLNPNVLNRWMLASLTRIQSKLPFAGIAAVVALVVRGEVNRWRLRKAADPTTTLARLFIAIALATFLLHWLAFRVARIPLPSGRTALPLVLLWCLLFGVALSARLSSVRRDVIQWFAIAVLVATSAYFVGCLRLGYFREWRFDKDTKQLYWIASDLRTRCGITSFGIDWRYSSALDFYRLAYPNTSLPSFLPEESGKLPAGRSAYAIFYPTSEDLTKQQHLQVIYHNEETASAVAIRACAGP